MFSIYSYLLLVFWFAGGEPVEEDVDICGNASPILIGKDAQIRSGKCGSPSSSSSDSDSSSSGLCPTMLIFCITMKHGFAIYEIIYCKSSPVIRINVNLFGFTPFLFVCLFA